MSDDRMKNMSVDLIGGVYIATHTLGFLSDPVITGIGVTQDAAIIELRSAYDRFQRLHDEYVKRGYKP